MSHGRALALVLALIAGLAISAVGLASAFVPQGPPQPTDQHKELMRSVGEWEGQLTSFMPGMPPEPIPARERVEAIGGFWTQNHFECMFMGMPYHGTGVVGYDPLKKKYVGTWVDNMSSYLMIMEGTMDPKTRTLTMRWDAPGMEGKMVSHRYVAVMSDDSYTSTFYMGPGEGTKTMVIEMHRKKSATRPQGSR